MQVPADLSAVASEVRCSKQGCACCTGLHRHHKAHPAMWFGVWDKRRREEERFVAFVRRYHEYRSEDIGLLCAPHHAEVHLLYDRIIQVDRRRTGRPLARYTWAMAEHLMAELVQAYNTWLQRETPGVSEEELHRRRARYTV